MKKRKKHQLLTINKQQMRQMKNINQKKEIYGKLKELEKSLNLNDISKNHHVFGVHDFNSQAIYIPSTYHKNKYDVYGCL